MRECVSEGMSERASEFMTMQALGQATLFMLQNKDTSAEVGVIS